jgi:phage tail tube protein FII
MISQIEYMGTSQSSVGSGSMRGTTTTDQTAIFDTTALALVITVRGTLTVAASGKLKLQMAQNTSHADTASVYVGSYMKFNRIKSN